jgi:hypothetical protein
VARGERRRPRQGRSANDIPSDGAETFPIEPSRTGALDEASCAVCEFVRASVDRSIFFVAAEGISEDWFRFQMRKGGFCLRHARRLAHEWDFGLTGPYRDVIRGWQHRSSAAQKVDLSVGGACPSCATQSWADSHALVLLARGDPVCAGVTPRQVEPLCLHHLLQLLDRIAWPRVAEIAGLIEDRVRLAMLASAEVERPSAILRGLDPNGPAPRAGASNAATRNVPSTEPGLFDGSITADAVYRELEDGRCPVCSAVRAASLRYLEWLGRPAYEVRHDRDLNAVCREHLFDSAQRVPAAAARALAASIERWRLLLDLLADAPEAPPPLLTGRLRRVVPVFRLDRSARRHELLPVVSASATLRYLFEPGASVVERLYRARLQRDRACIACEATVTAAGRAMDLLGALLLGRTGVERFERTDGLCLRHLAALHTRADPRVHAVALRVASARAAQIGWELDEETRKSSWSVRYEPKGPEGSAWARALIFVLGDEVLAADFLATEPASAGLAA